MHRCRIAQTAPGKFNDLFSDEFGYRVGALGQAKPVTSLRECSRHRFDQFRIEGLAFQKGCDRHERPECYFRAG